MHVHIKRHPWLLTLQTVGIEQVLAFFVALHAALGATHALSSNAPQQSLAFVAVGGSGGRPHLEIVWRSRRDGVDQSLQGLFVDMTLLQVAQTQEKEGLVQAVVRCWKSSTGGRKPTSSSLPRVVEAMADVIPALREFCTRDFGTRGKGECLLCMNGSYSMWFTFIAYGKPVLTIA